MSEEIGIIYRVVLNSPRPRLSRAGRREIHEGLNVVENWNSATDLAQWRHGWRRRHFCARLPKRPQVLARFAVV